ncbi:hypothetical protein BH11PAT4_BH11PAT4_0210 [soil metagenome]
MKNLWLLLCFAVLGLSGCGSKSAAVQPKTKKPAAIEALRPRLPEQENAPEIKRKLSSMGVGLWIATSKDATKKDQMQLARAIGAGHILPRYAGNRRTLTKKQLKESADLAQAHGLKIMPWVYAYRKNQCRWVEEIGEVLGGHPAFAGIMINIEHTSPREALKELNEALEILKKKNPQILVGYTGYNLALTHSYVGINSLVSMVDFWSPQVYWAHNGASPRKFLLRGYEQWYTLAHSLGHDIVIAPAGQAYWSDRTIQKPMTEARADEFSQFVKETKGYPTISWYSGDELIKKGWAVRAVADANRLRGAKPQVDETPKLSIWVILRGVVLVLVVIIVVLFLRKRPRIS